MFEFDQASDFDKDVFYWHNVQRTDPKSLIPILQKEMESIVKNPQDKKKLVYTQFFKGPKDPKMSTIEGRPAWEEAIEAL